MQNTRSALSTSAYLHVEQRASLIGATFGAAGLRCPDIPDVFLASNWVTLRLADDAVAVITQLLDALGQALDRVFKDGFAHRDGACLLEMCNKLLVLGHSIYPLSS